MIVDNISQKINQIAIEGSPNILDTPFSESKPHFEQMIKRNIESGTPLLLSNMSPLFLQFLAWQRLCQINDQISTYVVESAEKKREAIQTRLDHIQNEKEMDSWKSLLRTRGPKGTGPKQRRIETQEQLRVITPQTPIAILQGNSLWQNHFFFSHKNIYCFS